MLLAFITAVGRFGPHIACVCLAPSLLISPTGTKFVWSSVFGLLLRQGARVIFHIVAKWLLESTMGYTFSRAQMEDYKELVKGRFSDGAIEFLFFKFHRAAPSGIMTPVEFKHYIETTGVFKTYKHTHSRASVHHSIRNSIEQGDEWRETVSDSEMYQHLFRGYDRDRDGVISFSEFLLYHLAVIYSTEELFVVVFNAYDADQDGLLSMNDIVNTITAATKYVGDCDIDDPEVRRVINEEAQRLLMFLDVRKDGHIRPEDMRLITQKHPEVLEKMKNLM
uniref:Uncharacterized protein TCIL3000_10_10750 n=1 Tax=Trypanosoma congolense (strain IL3000) TaxID=1068625 RepID=G0UY29_TRYCI|nr:unnamed protein product [Trypanosoma congolense IL3000]